MKDVCHRWMSGISSTRRHATSGKVTKTPWSVWYSRSDLHYAYISDATRLRHVALEAIRDACMALQELLAPYPSPLAISFCSKRANAMGCSAPSRRCSAHRMVERSTTWTWDFVSRLLTFINTRMTPARIYEETAMEAFLSLRCEEIQQEPNGRISYQHYL